MIARFLYILSIAVGLAFAAAEAQTKPETTISELKSNDQSRALIVPVDHINGGHESRVEFYDSRGTRLCSADYSSTDGTHGFAVVKAAWSPDGRYYVYSMNSSGGHQPWHSPTEFFIRDDHQLCHLDAFFGSSGVATPSFKFRAPNTLTTEIDLAMRSVTVSLDSLRQTNRDNGAPKCLPCERGRVLDFGDETQPQHSPK